jgi:hypothetical protein
MQRRSHNFSGNSAFHLALIAFVCVVFVLLSGSSPTRLADTDWPARQINDRVEQIEALNHTTGPMLGLDIRFADHVLDYKSIEPDEPADDHETKHYILLRSDVAAIGSQTSLYEWSADRALTPFRLLAFWSRGSPSA